MSASEDELILIGIGANLRSPATGPAIDTCRAALLELERRSLVIARRSAWYRAAPLPPAPLPWYVNGVVAVETGLGPEELLGLLQAIEHRFGRQRVGPNAARVLDLDLLAWQRLVRSVPAPVLPHPRMQERAFVLRPLAEIAPAWRHPLLDLTPAALLARLWPGQIAEPFPATP